MTVQKYTPIETERLRDEMIRDDVVPTIQRAFDAYPALQSATLLVAQYWCDEANDAVHCDLIFSELATPNIDAAYRARLAPYESLDREPPAPSGWRAWLPWFGGTKATEAPPTFEPARDITNLPSELDPEQLQDQFTRKVPWDSNGEPISLFAAFCREHCHQGTDDVEAYSPYAVFRRQNGNINIEVVGMMIRPWLDGLKPQYDGDE